MALGRKCKFTQISNVVGLISNRVFARTEQNIDADKLEIIVSLRQKKEKWKV